MVTFAQGISVADILSPYDHDNDFVGDFLKDRQATSLVVPQLPPTSSDPLGQRCIQLFVKNQARHSLRKAYKKLWKGEYNEEF